MGIQRGRQKGALNKDKALPREMANRLGVDPLEILLLFAKGDWEALGYESGTQTVSTRGGGIHEEYTIPVNVRAKAAGDAVKYLYAQLRSVDGKYSVTIEEDGEYAHLTNEELDNVDRKKE